VVICLGLFVLALAGKISYEELQNGLLWALGIFSVANVGQKIGGTIK